MRPAARRSHDLTFIPTSASWGALALAAVTVAAVPARAAPAADEPSEAVERELATAARLPTILRLVGERNAELREVTARARAAEARTAAAPRMPDPELKGELWGVPLARP